MCPWDCVDQAQGPSSWSPFLSHLSLVPAPSQPGPGHPRWQRRGIRRANLGPRAPASRPRSPMQREEGLRESAGGGVGTTQLPRAFGEGRLGHLALRSQPEQRPRTQPRVPLTAQRKVCPKEGQGAAETRPLPPLVLRQATAAGTGAGGLALVTRPSEGQTSWLTGGGWILASNSTKPGAAFLFYLLPKVCPSFPFLGRLCKGPRNRGRGAGESVLGPLHGVDARVELEAGKNPGDPRFPAPEGVLRGSLGPRLCPRPARGRGAGGSGSARDPVPSALRSRSGPRGHPAGTRSAPVSACARAAAARGGGGRDPRPDPPPRRPAPRPLLGLAASLHSVRRTAGSSFGSSSSSRSGSGSCSRSGSRSDAAALGLGRRGGRAAPPRSARRAGAGRGGRGGAGRADPLPAIRAGPALPQPRPAARRPRAAAHATAARSGPLAAAHLPGLRGAGRPPGSFPRWGTRAGGGPSRAPLRSASPTPTRRQAGQAREEAGRCGEASAPAGRVRTDRREQRRTDRHVQRREDKRTICVGKDSQAGWSEARLGTRAGEPCHGHWEGQTSLAGASCSQLSAGEFWGAWGCPLGAFLS